MEVIDTRLAGMERVAADLVGATEGAEQVKAELERQMRQVKRIEASRLAAIPRELAEPKGLAERLAESPPPAAALPFTPDAATGAPEPQTGGRTITINMI